MPVTQKSSITVAQALPFSGLVPRNMWIWVMLGQWQASSTDCVCLSFCLCPAPLQVKKMVLLIKNLVHWRTATWINATIRGLYSLPSTEFHFCFLEGEVISTKHLQKMMFAESFWHSWALRESSRARARTEHIVILLTDKLLNGSISQAAAIFAWHLFISFLSFLQVSSSPPTSLAWPALHSSRREKPKAQQVKEGSSCKCCLVLIKFIVSLFWLFAPKVTELTVVKTKAGKRVFFFTWTRRVYRRWGWVGFKQQLLNCFANPNLFWAVVREVTPIPIPLQSCKDQPAREQLKPIPFMSLQLRKRHNIPDLKAQFL